MPLMPPGQIVLLRDALARGQAFNFPGGNGDGATGPPGPPGAAGAPGSVWRDGTGAPSNALGINGDYYLNDANGDVYYKSAGAYTIVANIKGTTGSTGATGASGTASLTTKGDVQGFDTAANRIPVGSNGKVLTADSTAALGVSWQTPSAGASHPTIQLDYVETTDIATGLAIGNGSWSDLNANQNFTVSAAGTAAVMVINVNGCALCGFGTAAEIAARLIIDSAGTPITRKIGGITTNIDSPIAGCSFAVTGLSAGTHTIKIQLYASAAGNLAYCRCSSQANNEFLSIQVLEY